MNAQPEFLKVSDLSSFMKTMLIEAYDKYIQDANDEDKYKEGWYPVCINEFLNSKFLEIIKEKGYQVTKKQK